MYADNISLLTLSDHKRYNSNSDIQSDTAIVKTLIVTTMTMIIKSRRTVAINRKLFSLRYKQPKNPQIFGE